MALHRGIQSAIFYYLSCAPCAEARYRKKRKREAALDRADREALEAEMPDLYRHPSPSSTNPYWGAEIAAGPVLSSRGGRRNNNNKGGGAYSQGGNDSQRRLKTATTQRSSGSSVEYASRVASRDGASAGGLAGGRGGQAAGEESWAEGMGSAERLPSRSTAVSGSTFEGGAGITKPPRAVTRGGNALGSSYTSFSNPHVNDLVPATVTQINSREEAASLMLGPPNPEYMAGRVGGAARSRSTSGTSSQLTARSTGIPLSREVSRRMIERKLQSGEAISRQSSSRTMEDLKGQPHDRMATEAKDFAGTSDDSPPLLPSGIEKLRPSLNYAQNSEDSTGTVLHDPLLAPEPVHRTLSTRAATRPALSTIVSSENVTKPSSNGSIIPSGSSNNLDNSPALLSSSSYSKENSSIPPTMLLRSTHSETSINGPEQQPRDRTQRRSPVLAGTNFPHDLNNNNNNKPPSSPPRSPIRILPSRKFPQPTTSHPDTTVLNTQIFSSAASPGRRDQSSAEDGSLGGPAGGNAGAAQQGQQQGGAAVGLFDSWYTPDFALPEWVHEHTKREVSQRWSMDI